MFVLSMLANIVKGLSMKLFQLFESLRFTIFDCGNGLLSVKQITHFLCGQSLLSFHKTAGNSDSSSHFAKGLFSFSNVFAMEILRFSSLRESSTGVFRRTFNAIFQTSSFFSVSIKGSRIDRVGSVQQTEYERSRLSCVRQLFAQTFGRHRDDRILR